MSRFLFPTLAAAVLSSTAAWGQLNSVVTMLPTKETWVLTTDGQEIMGNVTTSFAMNGELKSFTLKEENGTTHKFKAEDVKEVRAKLTAMAKLSVAGQGGPTAPGVAGQVMSIINATRDDIWKKDLIIYHQIEVKPGKFSLVQLLNPGVNTVISVYPAPNIQGTEDQYYYAVKGGQVTKVVRKDYAKVTYPALFSDCEAYYREYPMQDHRELSEFATHVTNYNAKCAP